jgi:hypothetical protein
MPSRARTPLRKQPPLPEFAPMDRWCLIAGIGKTTTYQALAAGHLRAKKVGRRLLIDVPHGLRWIRSLPAHNVRLSNSRRPVGQLSATAAAP